MLEENDDGRNGPDGSSELSQPNPTHELSSDDKTNGMLCHILSLSGIVVPFGNIIGPLILWLIKKEESKFVDANGKESLNFQISIFIYLAISILLLLILIGISPLLAVIICIILLITIGICGLVFPIIAGIKANEGIKYQYPLTIRIIK